APLLWDGRRWTLVNVGNTLTTLLPEVGPPLQIETRFFLHLVNTQTITVLAPPQTLPLAALSSEVHRHLTDAGHAAFDVANRPSTSLTRTPGTRRRFRRCPSVRSIATCRRTPAPP